MDTEGLVCGGGVVFVIGVIVWVCVYFHNENIELTNEYNAAAKEEDWEPLAYDSHVDADDVRRAVLLHKLHIKPTADNVLNAPKRSNNTVIYAPTTYRR